MSVSEKLQVRPGASVAVIGLPGDVDLELPPDITAARDAAHADVVIVFVTSQAELEPRAAAVVAAARRDALTWVAYPKAGQRNTDLDRDSLAQLLANRGARAVRQVAIDDVWSALRFRPA